MPVTIALAGDTMLGRGVAEVLERTEPGRVVADEIAAAMRDADLAVLNLECCISRRGTPWPDPHKPFFFRAPPQAVELLARLGVDAVNLANNHALDFGAEALLDTLEQLDRGGIGVVGAGRDVDAARRPLVLRTGGRRVGLLGATDHPAAFAATATRPGVAYADLHDGIPGWLLDALDAAGHDADLRLLTVHWGPNMTRRPVPHVRRAADVLATAGVEMVTGHSAHVFHGARLRTDPPRAVLYDLGDFVDDYAVDPWLRNDLGLLWFVLVDADGPVGVEALPLRLRPARTEPAVGDDRTWIRERLTDACRPLGTAVHDRGDRLVLSAA